MRNLLSLRVALPAIVAIPLMITITVVPRSARGQSACAQYVSSGAGDQPFAGQLLGSSQVTETTGFEGGVEVGVGVGASHSKSITYNVGTYRDEGTGRTKTIRCDTYEEIGG